MLDLETLDSTREEEFEDMDMTEEEIQVTTGKPTQVIFSSWEQEVPIKNYNLNAIFSKFLMGAVVPEFFSKLF